MIYYLYVTSIVSAFVCILKLGVHIGRIENETEENKAKFDILGTVPFFIVSLWGLYLITKEWMVV